MRIRLRSDGAIANVYYVYWGGDRTYFAGFLPDEEGLIAFDSKEADVIERNLGADWVYFVGAYGKPGFIHPYLLEDKLLDSLIEYDSEAYRRLVERLGKAP
jgi:hypothetical protein